MNKLGLCVFLMVTTAAFAHEDDHEQESAK
jgi:hypothetical protein